MKAVNGRLVQWMVCVLSVRQRFGGWLVEKLKVAPKLFAPEGGFLPLRETKKLKDSSGFQTMANALRASV